MIDIKGYIREVGDFNVVQEKHQTGRSTGVVIEIGSWDVTITGLTKKQCKELAAHLLEPINVRLEF